MKVVDITDFCQALCVALCLSQGLKAHQCQWPSLTHGLSNIQPKQVTLCSASTTISTRRTFECFVTSEADSCVSHDILQRACSMNQSQSMALQCRQCHQDGLVVVLARSRDFIAEAWMHRPNFAFFCFQDLPWEKLEKSEMMERGTSVHIAQCVPFLWRVKSHHWTC